MCACVKEHEVNIAQSCVCVCVCVCVCPGFLLPPSAQLPRTSALYLTLQKRQKPKLDTCTCRRRGQDMEPASERVTEGAGAVGAVSATAAAGEGTGTPPRSRGERCQVVPCMPARA